MIALLALIVLCLHLGLGYYTIAAALTYLPLLSTFHLVSKSAKAAKK